MEAEILEIEEEGTIEKPQSSPNNLLNFNIIQIKKKIFFFFLKQWLVN